MNTNRMDVNQKKIEKMEVKPNDAILGLDNVVNIYNETITSLMKYLLSTKATLERFIDFIC